MPEHFADGKTLLFTIAMSDNTSRLAVQSLETGERWILEKAAGFARYVPTGHLIYHRGETLVYFPRGTGMPQLVWVNRQGQIEQLNLEPVANRRFPRLSADGSTLEPELVQSIEGRPHVWSGSPDGKELFYLEGDALKAASVDRTPALRFGRPQIVFKGPIRRGNVNFSTYDVAPDGRFVIRMEPSEESTHLVVVENWFDELKRLVPTH